MAVKLIQKYQGWWDSSQNRGHFWFTYYDNTRERTVYVNGLEFQIIMDMLRNEKPVYGDHTRALVTTQSEETGEEES